MFQKVRVDYTLLTGRMLLDGRECYKTPSGHILFASDSSHAVDYIVKVERGLALQPNEKVAFRDGNVSNLDPSNLIVFQRGENETPQNFQYRIDAATGKVNANLNFKPLEERVPDLTTRPITKASRQPLRVQIKALQRIVNKRLKRGQPTKQVREVARNLMRLSYPDVKLSDIVFGDEFQIPQANRIVTVPPPKH